MAAPAVDDADRRVLLAAVRGAVARPAGTRAAATALAWLYLYSVLWLTAYAVVASLALGWKPVVITGGSMEPAIVRGDLVMVGGTGEALGRGTVVTFEDPAGRGLVTHRVTEALPTGYRTRGDANAAPDSDLVPHAAVRGTGRLLVPLIGKPYVWLRGGEVLPLGAWAVASVAAVALATRRQQEEDQEAVVHQAATPPALLTPAVFIGPTRDVLPQRGPRHGRLRVAHG